MYKPDFPTHNYLELQRSRIQIGDKRHLSWDTTYNDTMRPKTQDLGRQSIDTCMLQRTHWTPGDLKNQNESEYHERYKNFGTGSKRETVLSRDQMNRTSFTLGDGSPMASRATNRGTPVTPDPRVSFQEKMVATHFDLKNPSVSEKDWATSNKTDFRPFTAKPAQSAQIELNKGLGAKSSFENYGAFRTDQSLARASYSGARPQTTQVRNRSVTIQGDQIDFEQNTTNKWQRTNFKVGDTEKRYSTTSADALRPPKNPEHIDPHYSQNKRLAFARSTVGAGNCFPTVKDSAMKEAIVPHPECKPPPMAEKSAFISHHDFRNFNGKINTTMHDALPPRKAEPVEPINNHLQTSHMVLGAAGVHVKSTLSQDTYTKPPRTMEKADVDAARNFHMSHHSKTSSNSAAKTEITTNQATYIGCPGGKPSDMCDSLKGGHNIVPHDPRFSVKKSAMKEDFHPYPNVQPPPPIDNLLQRSHIQIQQDKSAQWKTTQQDYFQFNTYRLPGDPR